MQYAYFTAEPVEIGVFQQNLLKMLLAKRIDAILANQLVMNALLKETASESKVRSVLEQDKPLGVYFSDQFLSQQADDFMQRFNQTLGKCRN
jgi:polar amino acid transport system substrate-binding protein